MREVAMERTRGMALRGALWLARSLRARLAALAERSVTAGCVLQEAGIDVNGLKAVEARR